MMLSKKEFIEQFKGIRTEKYNGWDSLSDTLTKSLYLNGSIEKCIFAVATGGHIVKAHVDFNEDQFLIEGGVEDSRDKLSKALQNFFEDLEPLEPVVEAPKNDTKPVQARIIGLHALSTVWVSHAGGEEEVSIETIAAQDMPDAQRDANLVGFTVTSASNGEPIILFADFNQRTVTSDVQSNDNVRSQAHRAFEAVYGSFQIDS